MPPLLRFTLRRLAAIPISLLIITALLYASVILTPPEIRAELFMPKNTGRLTTEQYWRLIQKNIVLYHLDESFPVQYGMWLSSLARGNWGWSPAMQGDVLTLLLRRSPVTAELILYSIAFYIPLGLLSGALAGWRRGSRGDNTFRMVIFTSTTLPPFILAIVLMAVFYIKLGWFPPERLGYAANSIVRAGGFQAYTGLMTVDGLLNGRLDVTLDALRHLVLPVLSLSLLHLASLGQMTRTAVIEEIGKEYIVAARSRGLSDGRVLWRHAFRNALSPALTSSALSAAALFTGVIVIERIFNLKGISEMILAVRGVADISVVLGFSVFSVTTVLLLMFLLDMIQAVVDPRIRESIIND